MSPNCNIDLISDNTDLPDITDWRSAMRGLSD
jgi:hypothetical protein